VLLRPPQNPHDLTRDRARVATVGSRQLTVWAMARPSSDLHFLFLGISGSLRRRLSPGPGRCWSTQFERCAPPPPPSCSSLCNGRQTPDPGVPRPLLGCRLRVSVEAVAVTSSSSSRSPEARWCSEPVLLIGLQQTKSSSPSLLDVVEESSSSRTSCTSLR
jgi:hypothetical protein